MRNLFEYFGYISVAMSETTGQQLYQDIDYLGSASAFAGEMLATLNKGSLFDEFYQYEIEELCEFMHCFSAPAGTVLLKEGEEGDHLIIVMAGKVEVHKHDLTGKVQGIAAVGQGSVLGEMSLIDGEHRFASCIAVEPTLFAVLSRTDLNEIMALHPRLANKFLIMLLQMMVSRLRDTGMRAFSVSKPIV